MSAAKRKLVRCEKNRLHNALRASRHASPFSSPTDYAGRLSVLSLLHQQLTSTASHQALGGAARGACRLPSRQHHRLHPAGRRPATGFGRALGPPPPLHPPFQPPTCLPPHESPPSLSFMHPAPGLRASALQLASAGRWSWGARLLRQHSADSRPAAGLGRPWVTGWRRTRWRGSKSPSTSRLCGLPPGSQHWPNRMWGGGWRGARWRGPLSTLRSTGSHTAAGLGRL